MVEYYKLDKILTVGTTYQMPPDRFYVIRKIGTDDTSAIKLVIDGVETGEITQAVAPIHKTSSYLFGPVDLGDLYYVVPPDKTFEVEGTASKHMRVIGQIGKLAPGEAMPSQHLARFNAQGKHYLAYVSDSLSFSASGTWAAGIEQELYSLTPKTVETYIFNNYVGIDVSGDTFSAGDIGVRFFIDGTPLDMLTSDPGHKGLDLLSFPAYDDVATNEVPFSLKDLPINVLGDHTFTIKLINNTGSTYTFSADTTFTLYAITEYMQK